MEDFEYSVEICDRDWDCFFAACEECNLLPPSLAGVDDSGMSEIDDTGSILAARVQKVDQTASFSEADRPVDGPPDCEGSPVERYLGERAVGGMESVLSGSEEDIHLQSVNMFFENQKNLTDAERLVEPSQARDGKKREAIREEEQCSDGQRASSTSLPKNIPKLNSLPASGETAVGNETAEPVDTISNINTMKKDVPASNISPEPAASKLALKTNKSACPETRSFIREEACTETRVNEATPLNQSHDSPEEVVCSEITPHTDRAITVEMCTPLDDKREDLLTRRLTLNKKCSSDSSSNQETVAHVKRKEDPDVLQSDAARTNKTACQQSSPSASIKRKRRKKRRLSVEPAESVHGSERQVVRQSDSEEEQHAWRGGLCLSEDIHLSYLQPQKCASLPIHSAASNLPAMIPEEEIRVNYLSQYQYLLESIVRKGSCQVSADNNATTSVNPLSQTDDRASSPNNNGNVAANLQPCGKLYIEESTTGGVTGKSDPATDTSNCARKDFHTGSLQQSDKTNHSSICCENGQNPESGTAEVKSISILPSAESNVPTVAVNQCDILSAAKSVLAAEAGSFGNHMVCHRQAEPQQQLEIDCRDTDRYRSTLEKSLLSASTSDAHNTKPKQFRTEVGCAKLASDPSNALLDKNSLAQSPSGSTQHTEHPLVPHTLSKFNVSPEENTTDEKTELATSHIMSSQSVNPSPSGEIHPSQRETTSSTPEDLLTSPSHITPESSCCTLDTESVMSVSNENITDMSCLFVNRNNHGDQAEETSLIMAKHEEGHGTSESEGRSLLTDSKCDSLVKAEDVITASKAQCEPDSKHTVFAISSFWSEMEKLTINDILGLRMITEPGPVSSLPPLQESEEADMFAMTDSGFFNQMDESKSEQIHEDTPSDPISVESSLGSVIAVDSSSSRGVTWESLGADSYPENKMLTSARDVSQPVLPEGAQTCLHKLSKNISVHNLHALESEFLGCTRKGQTLQTVDEGELQKVECFTDGHVPKQDKDVASDSYRVSITDIFHYLFGGKQSVPSQSSTDDITTCYTDGNSVPETYDHFFSEFDTESFFYPLTTAEHQTKDTLVPIFSCSRSANRNLQFPEAYDHFLASSSSDESSDEEDGRGPVRVVTRFSHTSSASQISTDIYDDFFTDSDLRQNFFWKTTLSFRNMSLTGSTVQKQTLSNPLPVSCVPVRHSGRSPRGRGHPINALGNQDMRFPDLLLRPQPLRCEDLQMAVSNPILLANVSALSAIRYLRKYVKTEAAADEKKANYTDSSDS